MQTRHSKIIEKHAVAKYNHRVFEMYEFRDEAIKAITSKAANAAAETKPSESWEFEFLNVSRLASVTHVEFKKSQSSEGNTTGNLRRDFAKLSEILDNDSRVLLDFTGQGVVSTVAIDAIVSFNTALRQKGSRMVLCCLDPAVRSSFFPGR